MASASWKLCSISGAHTPSASVPVVSLSSSNSLESYLAICWLMASDTPVSRTASAPCTADSQTRRQDPADNPAIKLTGGGKNARLASLSDFKRPITTQPLQSWCGVKVSTKFRDMFHNILSLMRRPPPAWWAGRTRPPTPRATCAPPARLAVAGLCGARRGWGRRGGGRPRPRRCPGDSGWTLAFSCTPPPCSLAPLCRNWHRQPGNISLLETWIFIYPCIWILISICCVMSYVSVSVTCHISRKWHSYVLYLFTERQC